MDGKPIIADGATLTYFGGTDAQHNDHDLYLNRPGPYDRRVSDNGSAASVVSKSDLLERAQREGSRLERLSATSGTTMPDYTIEEVLVGGGAQAGKAVVKTIGRTIAGKAEATVAGVASRTAANEEAIRAATEVADGNRSLPGSAGHAGANTVTPGGTGTALSGHGAKIGNPRDVIIPEGTFLTLPRPNISILDRTGQYMENGDWEGLAKLARTEPQVARDINGMATWLPGARVPGYTLYPPDSGINLYRKSHSVSSPTPLVKILEPNMGCIQWAVCTTFLPKLFP